MGNKKENMIALCKLPGYGVQAHIPPLREEAQGRKEGQGSDWEQEGRPKFRYLKPMRGRQPRSMKY